MKRCLLVSDDAGVLAPAGKERPGAAIFALHVTALAAQGGTIYVGTDNGLVRVAENNLR